MGLSSYFCKKKNGGEEGIRTLDTGLPYTPLAGERLRPLGHLSTAVDRQGEQGFQVNLLICLCLQSFYFCTKQNNPSHNCCSTSANRVLIEKKPPGWAMVSVFGIGIRVRINRFSFVYWNGRKTLTRFLFRRVRGYFV